ncbi:MAG: FAD binding domain-containing protein [Anaerolineaceae bacterium]|nr:FAD binding domain-containing protein [Anaerolineaceae bacterium]
MTDNHTPHSAENTHLLYEFAYREPATIKELLALKDEYGKDAEIQAGGTHLMTMLKMNRAHPEMLVNINQIPELKGITHNEDGELLIAANTSIHEIEYHTDIQKDYPALSEACAAFGSKQIEIMGTVGGNLCNGSPASDTPPALLVYDARVVLLSSQGTREMPLSDFLVNPRKTKLKENEIMTAVILPIPQNNCASAYIKITRVAADLAKASIAVRIQREGDKIISCEIAMGAVAPKAIRLARAEAFLAGKTFSDEVLMQAAEIVSEDISPIDDIRSTTWYRREVSKAMTVDALHLAWERCGKVAVIRPNKIVNWFSNMARTPVNLDVDDERDIFLKVNGKQRRIRVKAHELLLNVLRDRLNLTGAKYGCGLGECGACTVLMDDVAVLSCLTLAVHADGRSIKTVEGLEEKPGKFDPVQEAYMESKAFQCGYCTPGFLMTTKSLLNELPKPSEDEIREYLKGNRCRCTGYASIVRAVVNSVEKQ